MSEHIALPFYDGTFDRKKHRGGGYKKRDNTKDFSEVQVFQLGKIKQDFADDKKKLSKYFDPNLIFKLTLSQKVDEQAFTQFLARSGITLLSPSPSGIGYWVILAEDEDLGALIHRLELYGESAKYNEFNAIESFDEIPVEEKIGEQLSAFPLIEGNFEYVDVEYWRMPDDKIGGFLEGIQALISSSDGQVTDTLVTENLLLARVRIDKGILDEVLKLREVSRVDRPPTPYLSYSLLLTPLEDINIGPPPPEDAAAVAVLDSGILSNHPLLATAVGDELAVSLNNSKKIDPDNPSDDVGHGTEVAGIALYGDLRQCIEDNQFNPEIWILSVKLMYAETNPLTGDVYARYDESELLEHQLEKAVSWVVSYKNCKVINISFGNPFKRMYSNKRQFPLSTLIDDLAKQYEIVFVISAGNIQPDYLSSNYPQNYPEYLIQDTQDTKIMDPASSAYALTVGSITQPYGPFDTNPQQLMFSPADTHYPSPFTCVGLGYKSMIKPELVEEGGNLIFSPGDPLKLPDIAGNLIVLNQNWINDGRLFSVNRGTSLAAPKVSHHCAKIINAFPNATANTIKALTIVTSKIPSERPGSLANINIHSNEADLLKLLSVYGYGKPNLQAALSSDMNNVLLLAENKIKLDGIHLYYLFLPSEFVETQGKRSISVALVYSPPIRRNRVDYLGLNMEFHLFRNSDIEEIKIGYGKIKIEEETEDIVPPELKIREVSLRPGVRARSRGIHQRAFIEYSSKPGIDTNKPLVLAVISQKRWIAEPDYLQDYTVVVAINHQSQVDLYNAIQQQIQVQQRIRLRQ